MIAGFILALVLLLWWCKKYGKGNTRNHVVSGQCMCDGKEYTVKGKMNSFVVSAKNGFEFLIQNGEIVACRDKQKGGKFIQYSEGRE